MHRDTIVPHLERIDGLFDEINTQVLLGSSRVVDFRADLAGLFVVAVAAMYESCIKDSIVTYASQHGYRFEYFAANSFNRLNSRIRIGDLNKYAKNFDVSIHGAFNRNLQYRKEKFDKLIGRGLVSSYDQLLDWRHDFAHAGRRNTTLEEAIDTHRIARHVVFAFHDAFLR